MSEEVVAPFQLINPNIVLVEPVRPSGVTDSGLYVLDQESNFDYKTSMLVEVIGKHEACPYPDVTCGDVYVCPVYCWDDMEIDGETYHYTHVQNLQCKIEGYYQAQQKLAQKVGAV